MPARSVSGWRGADRSAADVVGILVTGSSGHLGEALVRVLRVAGDDVVGLDVLPSGWTDVVASVTDRAAVRAVPAGVDRVHVNDAARIDLGWRPE